MKVTIVPIMTGAFGTITKGLLKCLEDLEVGGRVETIQIIALLRTARILMRVQETWGDLLSLKLRWKPSANTDVKNAKRVNNNDNNFYTTTSYLLIVNLANAKFVQQSKSDDFSQSLKCNFRVNIVPTNINYLF